MTHDPVEELLGVYALDALDADERARVEAHLADCPRCRAEVDAHREVAGQLALSGAPAPARVWDRIADALAGTDAGVAPPPLRLVAAPRRSRWRQAGGIAAVAAAVVAVVVLGVSSVRQGDRIDQVEQGQALAAAATGAFASPEARTAELATGDGTVLGRAAVLPDGNGYLLVDALPDLPDGTYQLWGDTGAGVVSLGPLGAAPTVRSFPAAGPLTRLMITAEDGPVAAPTTDPLVVGVLA